MCCARLAGRFYALLLQKCHNPKKISAQLHCILLLFYAMPTRTGMSASPVWSKTIPPISSALVARHATRSCVRKQNHAPAICPLHCKVCKQPLAAMDGENILKYFLISRPKARQSQAQPRLHDDRKAPDV